jgi:hypothetical protein
MASLTEKLLNADVAKFEERDTAKVYSPFLTKAIGSKKKEYVTIKQMSQRQYNEIVSSQYDNSGNVNPAKSFDMGIELLAESIIDPNIKDEALISHFGVSTKYGLVEKLFGKDVQSLVEKCVELNQSDDEAEEEAVKN